MVSKCSDYLNYGETGFVADSNCKSTLICNTNAALNRCKCPATSVSWMCDCARSATNETYWDAALGACVPDKDYMQRCDATRNYTCQTRMNNLQCTSSGLCDCSSVNPGLSINNVCKDCGAGAFYWMKRNAFSFRQILPAGIMRTGFAEALVWMADCNRKKSL